MRFLATIWTIHLIAGCIFLTLAAGGCSRKADLEDQANREAQEEAEEMPGNDVLFVDTKGLDENPGTKSKPLATLHAARDRIRSLREEGGIPEGGVTVFLRGGHFILNSIDEDRLLARSDREPDPGHFSATTFKLEWDLDSATKTAPTLFRNYENESVKLVRGPKVDFRVSLIMNQADHVFFEGIQVEDALMELFRKKPRQELVREEGESLVLVSGGHGNAIIVVPDQPTPVEEFAAKELIDHIKMATGVELRKLRESDLPADQLDAHPIFLGGTRAAAEEGLDPSHLAPGGYLYLVRNGRMFLLGRDRGGDPLEFREPWIGTAQGVSRWLQKSLGVRWLWPGELGTQVPKKEKISVEPV